MLKNRTFLGIFCIIIAIALVFGISPLFNKIFEGKKSVIILKYPVEQGQVIKSSHISLIEMGSYNLPEKAITDPKTVVGKHAVSDLFAGGFIFPDMISDTFDTSASVLRNLKENERAMSITIKTFASGFSGKLIMGDIISIYSIDDEDNAVLFDELRYVEVLTTTTANGADYLNKSVADYDGAEEAELPDTITVILQDERQALRITECENKSLYAVFVSRDEKKNAEYLKNQLEIIEKIKEEEEAAENEQDENPGEETKAENRNNGN